MEFKLIEPEEVRRNKIISRLEHTVQRKEVRKEGISGVNFASG